MPYILLKKTDAFFSVVLLKTLEAAIAVVTYSQVRSSACEITRARGQV